MNNNIYIKDNSHFDIKDIYNLSKSCIKNSWSLKSFEEDFYNVFSKYYSLVLENKIIGFISMWIVVDEITLTNIAIEKTYRGKGLSKYLMNFLINSYKNFNIFLEVRESNLIAINLYKHFGFKTIYKRENYYKNPIENALIMKKF